MAAINRLKRELLFKIVFYGPGLGGKTTTLQHVHAATKPESRGNLVSLATDTDRTLYFDCLPLKLLKLGDMTVKLQLFTVPGQVYYAATRKLVLTGADGIVFCADTQAARLDANLESLDDLNANLAEQGQKLSAVPHVFQWNKRDLPGVVPLDELDRRLNLFGAPSTPTVATRGDGVFDLLERVTRLVVEAYRAELPATGAKLEKAPLFLDAEEVGLADAIKELADSQPVRAPSTAPRRAFAATRPGLPGGPLALLGSPLPSPIPVAASPLPAGSPIPGPRSPGAAALMTSVSSARQASPPPSLSSSSNGTTATFSMAELWPPADRPAVSQVEGAIAAGELSAAITACEDLLSRVLAAGSVLLGGQAHARDTTLMVTLLGLDGTRYLGFRAVARGVRAKRDPSLREAVECYAFAVEARRALDRVIKGQ